MSITPIKLICQRSGLPLGDFLPHSTMAGGTPYAQAWKDTILLHPIFAQSLGSLLHRANAYWQLEKTGKRQWPLQQKQLMFLALLHSSDCIVQDAGMLPSEKIVETTFLQLLELLSWKDSINSERLQFPKLHIAHPAKRNAWEPLDAFANVGAWLQACFNCRDDYENTVRERRKDAKKAAHIAAMRSIKRQMYADISIKRLWSWIDCQVPQMEMVNSPELKELFFIDDNKVQHFAMEDIEALEGMVLNHCELGSSVSHEVMQRIKHIRAQHSLYTDTFEIVLASSQFPEYAEVPEPQERSFTTKAAWLVARARWQIAQKTKQLPVTADEL